MPHFVFNKLSQDKIGNNECDRRDNRLTKVVSDNTQGVYGYCMITRRVIQ